VVGSSTPTNASCSLSNLSNLPIEKLVEFSTQLFVDLANSKTVFTLGRVEGLAETVRETPRLSVKKGLPETQKGLSRGTHQEKRKMVMAHNYLVITSH
jgi:hypothetical protein